MFGMTHSTERLKPRTWRGRLLERIGVYSPSRALINAMNGTATKGELEVLASSARNLGRMAEQMSPEERELLEMQADWSHPGWDAPDEPEKTS